MADGWVETLPFPLLEWSICSGTCLGFFNRYILTRLFAVIFCLGYD